MTPEARAAHASRPAMIIQGPGSWRKGIVRPAQPRTAKQRAANAWAKAVAEFDHLPLVLKAGDADNPDGDYGGVGALFNFDHGSERPDHVNKNGVFFSGLPSCSKRHKSTEHVPKTCKPYIHLLRLLITSMADLSFPCFWPRLSANVGHKTEWHR